jgi:CheY-like chemotaxis protein
MKAKSGSYVEETGVMKKKVLMIDDEVAFTNIVKLTLEARGDYEVCIENNPGQALAAARTFIPQIIILDVVMPEHDGGEVHSQFQADPILKRVPVIFLTAIVRKKEVDEHQGKIGGSVYLAKPVSAEDLVAAIENNIRA